MKILNIGSGPGETGPVANIRQLDELKIDVSGLGCSRPILQLAKGIKSVNDGELLLITASEPMFSDEVSTWCNRTGHLLHHYESHDSSVTLVIQRQSRKAVR